MSPDQRISNDLTDDIKTKSFPPLSDPLSILFSPSNLHPCEFTLHVFTADLSPLECNGIKNVDCFLRAKSSNCHKAGAH